MSSLRLRLSKAPIVTLAVHWNYVKCHEKNADVLASFPHTGIGTVKGHFFQTSFLNVQSCLGTASK